MIDRSKLVRLDEAETGMVLAEAVLDAQGGVLLPETTVLTDSLLRSLARRDVGHVLIVDTDIPSEEWDTACRRIEERIARLFRQCEGKGASDLLKQHVTEYRIGSAG